MAGLPTARHLAERISHRLILRRRLPPPFQKTRIHVTSEGGLRYLRPSLADVDPMLTRAARELIRPGHIVWDVGANVGLFTFAAAAAAKAAGAAVPGRNADGLHTGMVLALEPDTWLVNLLRRSLRIPNDRAPVEVLPVAAGARTGVAGFCIATRNRSTNYLRGFGTAEAGGVRQEQTVPVFALDDLLAYFPPPDLLKIDVEGAEVEVLTGAGRLLHEFRPTVICEVAARNSAAVTEILFGAGYEVFDAMLPLADRRPLSAAPGATLALRAGAATAPAPLDRPRQLPGALLTPSPRMKAPSP